MAIDVKPAVRVRSPCSRGVFERFFAASNRTQTDGSNNRTMIGPDRPGSSTGPHFDQSNGRLKGTGSNAAFSQFESCIVAFCACPLCRPHAESGTGTMRDVVL